LRILITGGAGFIGSHITDLYIKKGHQVAVVDNLVHGKRVNVHRKASFFHTDITSPQISRIFSKFKPQVVNHHAALVNVSESMKSPTMDGKVNVLGTLNLLENAKKTKVKQFIFASSVAVYGEPKKFPIKEQDPKIPVSFYGISKYIGEKYTALYKGDFLTAIFRYSNVYGPGQDSSAEGGVVAIFINNLVRNKDCIIYGDGKQTRDFVSVFDVAQANLLAAEKKIEGVFNISTNKKTSILNLYKLLKNKIESKGKVNFTKSRKGDIKKSVLDNSRAKKVLAWRPKYGLKEGIGETINYFRKQKTKDHKLKTQTYTCLPAGRYFKIFMFLGMCF